MTEQHQQTKVVIINAIAEYSAREYQVSVTLQQILDFLDRSFIGQFAVVPFHEDVLQLGEQVGTGQVVNVPRYVVLIVLERIDNLNGNTIRRSAFGAAAAHKPPTFQLVNVRHITDDADSAALHILSQFADVYAVVIALVNEQRHQHALLLCHVQFLGHISYMRSSFLEELLAELGILQLLHHFLHVVEQILFHFLCFHTILL